MSVVRSDEREIAVHWKEEEYILPSPKFIGQANLIDPAVLDRFTNENFPECFREYADLLDWDQLLAHDARHQQSAVLEMVRRRQAQRLLQLRRSPSREAQEQGGADLRPRTGERAAHTRDLPGAVHARERGRRRFCATSAD